MATYIIGDLQGCYEPLRRLLDHVAFDPSVDRLGFVGDLVNRGQQSLAVLRYIKSLGAVAHVVLGNHDLHLIMLAAGYSKAHREDTLTEVLKAPDRDELLAWLRAQPLFYAENDWAMVHAGLMPSWTVAQAQALADEVRTALTSPDYVEFLAEMWGSEPTVWSDELKGWPRLRFIVNAMTRMRYLTQTGAMEFRAPGSKAPPTQGPANCMPWFAFPDRASRDHLLLCGHWSALGFYQEATLLAIDTGCVWGGTLTAVRLEDRRIFCQPSHRQAQPSGWE
ncbi:MAG TPA: symmetrical bis(5'-nucleosyl)-tetraphosphatase [Rhodocyclaceae bacterium]|nr:symmetrical bis(5'-nucleosyl)-tetraphosphatase [Rhodocyclaceae bacterium]